MFQVWYQPVNFDIDLNLRVYQLVTFMINSDFFTGLNFVSPFLTQNLTMCMQQSVQRKWKETYLDELCISILDILVKAAAFKYSICLTN